MKKTSTLPLHIEKYTIMSKQKNKLVETGTNDNTNQYLNQQKNQWNHSKTKKIVELNTIIWKLRIMIEPEYGPITKDLHYFNLLQQYQKPNFLCRSSPN